MSRPRRSCCAARCTPAQALGLAGLGLAHAMAQALGGRYGLPHGAMNALACRPALRFNPEPAPEAVDASARRSEGDDRRG